MNMSKADSHNTTAAPVDQTRRRFLSQAAGVAASGSILALATLQPVAAMTTPAVAAAPVPEDPAIIALGERIEPLLAAYRSAAADRIKARANAEAISPAVPEELVCKGPFWAGCTERERDLEDKQVWPEDRRLPPRDLFDSKQAKRMVAQGNLHCDRRTKFGKDTARKIQIAERYEADRAAAIEHSGLSAAISNQFEAAYAIEELAREAAEIEPRTMAGAIIQARALAAYAEVEIVLDHYRGRAGQLVGLALAQSVSRIAG
jgi:hypothetical protein